MLNFFMDIFGHSFLNPINYIRVLTLVLLFAKKIKENDKFGIEWIDQLFASKTE